MLEAFRIDEAQAAPPPEPENFIGRVRMQNFAHLAGATSLEALAVFFDPGAHTRPHVHSTDQILLVTEGDGTLATESEEHDLTPGVVALIPANTKHWHGAKPGKSMTHWSILGPADTRIVD